MDTTPSIRRLVASDGTHSATRKIQGKLQHIIGHIPYVHKEAHSQGAQPHMQHGGEREVAYISIGRPIQLCICSSGAHAGEREGLRSRTCMLTHMGTLMQQQSACRTGGCTWLTQRCLPQEDTYLVSGCGAKRGRRCPSSPSCSLTSTHPLSLTCMQLVDGCTWLRLGACHRRIHIL
jgi:hypothetical protein